MKPLPLCCLLLLASGLPAQGPLEPPGAPVASFKTLAQVEPRIDLATVGSSTPGRLHEITEPGSYYLSANLGVDSMTIQKPILILAARVTLDLNGFTISGTPGFGTAIEVRENASSVTIRNGTITSFGTGISFVGSDTSGATVEGITISNVFHGMELAAHARVVDCTLLAASASSSGLATGPGTTIERCRIDDFDSYGIWGSYGMVITDCVVRGNQSGIRVYQGSVLRHCLVLENRDKGIYASTGDILIEGCSIMNNDGNGIETASSAFNSALQVRNCQLAGNGGRGIFTASAQVLVEDTQVSNSGSHGIQFIYSSADPAVRVVNCALTGNGASGLFSEGAETTITNCTATENNGSGFHCTGRAFVEECMAGTNRGQYGIYVGPRSTVRGCQVAESGSDATNTAGIYAGANSTLSDCSVVATATNASPSNSAQGVGITAGQGSTIRACEAKGNMGDGIRVGIGSQVLSCIAIENGGRTDDNRSGAGIHVVNYDNVVDGNTVYGNDRGIDVDSAYNLVVRNRARTNTTNYEIANGNRVGTIVSAPSSGAISGSTGGSGVGTTDPWANLSY